MIEAFKIKGHYRISSKGKKFWINSFSRKPSTTCNFSKESLEDRANILRKYNKSQKGREKSRQTVKEFAIPASIERWIGSDRFLKLNSERIIKYNKSEEHRRLAGRILSRLRKPTKSQKILSKCLLESGIKNILELRLPEIHRIIDIAIPEKWLAIEVDGSFHNSEKQKLDDKLKDDQLRSKGWKVIRVTNEEVQNNLQDVIEKIKKW